MLRTTVMGAALVSACLGGVAWAQPQDLVTKEPAAAETSLRKEVTGTVKGIDGKKIYIEYNGVVLPVHVTHDTSVMGSTTKLTQRLEPRLEKEFRPGDKVTISYELKKMDNYALSITKQ